MCAAILPLLSLMLWGTAKACAFNGIKSAKCVASDSAFSFSSFCEGKLPQYICVPIYQVPAEIHRLGHVV